MCEAVAARRKRRSTSRSKAGCAACRSKRRKCDEVKPVCGRCQKSKELCVFPTHQWEVHDTSSWAAHHSQIARSYPSRHDGRQSGSPEIPIQDLASPATVSTSSEIDTPRSNPNQDAHSRASSIVSRGSFDGSDSAQPVGLELSHIGKSIAPIYFPATHFRHAAGFPSIPPRVLSSGESKSNGIYMAHFISHVIDMVPFKLNVICNNMNATKAAEFAAMALSAANLANLKGSYANSATNPGGSMWAPERNHMKDALRYTKMALSTAIEHVSPRINEAVAAHLLLLFVEVELGTFEGLRRHLGSISNLTLSSENHLLERSFDSELVEAIADSNVMLRYVAGLWNHMSVQTESAHALSSLSHRALSNSATINLIASTVLVSSMRLVTFKAGQCHLETQPGTQFPPLLKRHWQDSFLPDIDHGSLAQQDIDLDTPYKECLDELRSQAKRLKGCKSPLLNAINKDTTPSTPHSDDTPASSGVEDDAIRFNTHEEAMEAAEYVFAHIFCDETVLSNFLNHRPHSNSQNPWLHLLLRIAKGLVASKCVSKNKYRRGIVGMIMQAALRCESPGPLSHLKHMIKKMIATGRSWEDFSTPLTHTLLVVELIEQQFHLGRQIMLVASRHITLDCDIFSSSGSSILMLYGREADGRLFYEEITINLSVKDD